MAPPILEPIVHCDPGDVLDPVAGTTKKLLAEGRRLNLRVGSASDVRTKLASRGAGRPSRAVGSTFGLILTLASARNGK